jgi:amino acid adenylation domain-containing protein
MSQPTSVPPNPSPEEIRARLRELLRERMGSTGSWYPLSHGQEALWFLWKLAPQSCAYNLVLPVGVRGALDVDAFRRSWQKLSDRHPCLRTEFQEEEGGRPHQRPLQQHPFNFEQVDASGWSEAQFDEAIARYVRRPFDLEADASPRVTLFRRAPDSHALIFVIHHILSDLWSLIVMMDELREVYQAEKAGTVAELPPLPLCYEDYVRWQRRLLEGDSGARLWDYWREELAGELPVLDLPSDHARPPLQTFRGGTITRRLDAELSRQLKRLASDEGVSLFMALLAAYEVLLYRYTGQENLVVGTPTSGRQRAELTGVFGDFVNMVPLRAELSREMTFRELLGQVRRKVLGAIRHQDYPFSFLVERLQATRDLSRSPIFQTSFVLQKFHRFEQFSRAILPGDDEPVIPFADLLLEPIPFAQQDGQFDINLEMKEDDGGRLMAAWKYSADLFEPDTVARMASQFESLLGEIAADPGRRLSELHLLTAEESMAAVSSGQGAHVELPAAARVCELFAAQVERRPRALAVSCGDASLTYSELGERVGLYAAGLGGLGVGPEVLVALLLPRGLAFVATLLAVSRAGGAFLPLDPRHPLSRTVQILESSGTPLVLTTRDRLEEVARAVGGLPRESRPRVACIEELAGARASEQMPLVDARRLPLVDARRLPLVDARGLAYVLFTSGSTGRPKGVMVEHGGMVNHTLAKLSDLCIGEDDTLAQNGPQSFDIVVWQCLAPLAVGGRVAVFPDEVAEDPSQLVAEVKRRGVTVLQLVPSMLHAVLEHLTVHEEERHALAGLRWVVPTGDALPTELCRRWLELYPDIPLLNTYGSTECSDDQCHYRLANLEPPDEAVAVASIGTPIHNMTAHVLDGNLSPLPVGIVGELYIGGLGVGRGYLQDPARTAAAFVPDPFGEHPGARLYRTRDMARRRADGSLDFLGRIDHMIKLRGFRIEPKEVEAALCRHPSVAEAAVLASIHPSGERQLVGYVVPSTRLPEGGGVPEADELRQHLAESLPHYMVPAAFCLVDSLPLNANGKLDLQRLPAPDWQTIRSEQFVAPRTPVEEKIAGVWAEVLGLERVGVTDDFFAVGGDSIRSIQIVARCKQMGLPITPSYIFLHPTVAALAALADKSADESGAALPLNVEEMDAAPLYVLHVSQEHLALALVGF